MVSLPPRQTRVSLDPHLAGELGGHRHVHLEGRALARLAVDVHQPAVLLDDRTHGGQPQEVEQHLLELIAVRVDSGEPVAGNEVDLDAGGNQALSWKKRSSSRTRALRSLTSRENTANAVTCPDSMTGATRDSHSSGVPESGVRYTFS